MKIEFKNLSDAESFGNSGYKSELPESKGKITLKASIHINPENGEIMIRDEKGLIQFGFNNLKLARKWADAIK